MDTPSSQPVVPLERERLRVAIVTPPQRSARRIISVLELNGLSVTGSVKRPEKLVGERRYPKLDAVVFAFFEPEALIAGVYALRDGLPKARLVAVLRSTSPKTIRFLLAKGLDGVVLENELRRSLAACVRGVCAGLVSIPSSFRTLAGVPTLSTREKQVLGMVVLGLSNGEIARKLYISENTVKSHLSSSFAKLGVRSRHEAVALILDPERGLGTGILAITQDENERNEPAST